MRNFVLFEGQKVYPSKIVCVGRNYVKHIEELNNEIPDDIVLFIKPNSSIGTPDFERFEYPIHYEGEISFLISGELKIGDKITKSVFKGIGFGLDFTMRDLQKRLKEKGLPWEKSKAFDGAAFFSEFKKIPEDFNFDDIKFSLLINGQTKQKSSSNFMLFKPLKIVEKIIDFFSLEENDIIMTGTPEGVGIVNPGDVLEYSINNIIKGNIQL